jgi:O-acetyl-ADP-ribose deacetylase (regulator of RNase III)
LHRIEIRQADIAALALDAIVNAANETLLGGGGVDGAIRRAAGPELLAACRTLHGCPIGQAKITKGYRLPARFVIHTVGPVWRGGENEEPALLASCYRENLLLAAAHDIEIIAFPAISRGVYGYPIPEAARIAIGTTAECLSGNASPKQVMFACFGPIVTDGFQAALDTRRP